jgi:uncharacterized damage-inducible protein DinB
MNAKSIISEMEQEFVSTKALLELVPEEKLEFKPHEKAMTLGQLAFHVAESPGRNLVFAKDGQVDATVITKHPIPNSKNEILEVFKKTSNLVNSILTDNNVEWLSNNWNLNVSDKTIASMPTEVFLRTFVLNHWYHHRGELATYLRILDIKLPSIYGPTADVNPFA